MRVYVWMRACVSSQSILVTRFQMVLTASYVPSQRIYGEVEHKNKPRTSEGTGRIHRKAHRFTNSSV